MPERPADKKNPHLRKLRGEYRPIFEALPLGKDFRKLHPHAKLVFFELKTLCGAAGIKAWPALVEGMAELTGLRLIDTRKAVEELKQKGWIDHEDGVVWVTRGLQFEPQMTPSNANHRQNIRNVLSGLPTGPIVDRFEAAYPEWVTEPTETEGTKDGANKERASRAIGKGFEAPAKAPPNPMAIHPQPQPLPITSPSPSPSTDPPTGDVDRSVELLHVSKLLTKSANKGIIEAFGGRHDPLVHSLGTSINFAEAIVDAGIDLEFAAAEIFAIARSIKPQMTKKVRSMGYFLEGLQSRWAHAIELRNAEGYHPKEPPKSVHADLFQRRAIEEARRGDVEYQAYCDERAWVWRETA